MPWHFGRGKLEMTSQRNVRGYRGRPREFDEVDVLDKAVLVFRERGFHGASITDLARGMGLSSGSIYKAFKDKRGVFLAALDRYLEARNERVKALLAEHERGRDKIAALIAFYVDSSHFEEGRLGCLVVSTASELATHDGEIAVKIGRALERNEQQLFELIEGAKADASINVSVDSLSTARLMLAVLQGLRVLGKARHQKADLQLVAQAAMRVLD